jgi:hypothetical protein
MITKYVSRVIPGLAPGLSLLFLALPAIAAENHEAPGVLGRTSQVEILSADFEIDVEKGESIDAPTLPRAWRASRRGAPTRIERVDPPEGGLPDSDHALLLQTQKREGDDSIQDDLLNPDFRKRLGQPLGRLHRPVVLVRLWVPPFEDWVAEHYNFGFRLSALSRSLEGPQNRVGSYYPSIWLADVSGRQDEAPPKPRWYARMGSGPVPDQELRAISKAGWWTLAIAFDQLGYGYYYARPGVEPPTIDDLIWKTTYFKQHTAGGPQVDSIGYAFFSMLAPRDGEASAKFIIDDFEVWVDPPIDRPRDQGQR